MADELDALLERVDDDGLRAELRDRVERLRRKRQFGLVFESHLPERVRLPDHPIRRGSMVVHRMLHQRTQQRRSCGLSATGPSSTSMEKQRRSIATMSLWSLSSAI